MSDATGPEYPEHPDLVAVYATSDTDVLPVIKSLLESVDIPFMVDGEAMIDLFPSHFLGPALHRPRGEARIFVQEDRAEEARALLKEDPQVAQALLAAEAEQGLR
ncbi:MAG: DUF2007 domain-containing protein [Acidobacteriota bacterium]